MMPLIKEFADGLAHLLFPHLCAGCTRPLLRAEPSLCTACNLSLPRTGFDASAENEAAVRFAGRIPFSYATSFCHFTTDGLLQHLLHRLKYKGDKTMGAFLGAQFGYSLHDAGWIEEIDAIIPVPLHARKEATRGFNQSAVIAQAMAEILEKKANLNVLTRSRYTESQTSKSREERVENVQNAFAIKGILLTPNPHILLVDDVLTTGATLESAALALLKIPGVKISIATIGIASL